MELQVLFSGVPYTGTLPQGEAVLVTQDSRRACPGAVFVCAKGMTTDGHDHARKALEAGAVCIVTERPLGLPGEVQVASGRKAYAQLCQNFFGRPAEKLRLVAVTGTNGKTTVTTLIKQTLEQAGCKAGLIGTIHTEIDAMDVPAKYTTPEPWDLNALFSRMVLAGCTFAVMEASSQALDQLRLWGLTFEVGVFTNLTQDHLDYHKTFENYFAAKKSLFSQVKHMVVNLDDSYGRRLLDEVHGPERITFSAGDDAADYTARNIRLSASGVKFEMVGRGFIQRIDFPMPGDYSVHNALARPLRWASPRGTPRPRFRPPAGCAAGARCCITARSPSCATMPTRATPLKRCSRALRLSWRGGWWCCMAARASAMQKNAR